MFGCVVNVIDSCSLSLYLSLSLVCHYQIYKEKKMLVEEDEERGSQI